MTPKQIEALQAVVGRELQPVELEQLAALVAKRMDVQIAEALSVGRVRVQSMLVGIGTVLSLLGDVGGAFLDTLVERGASDRNLFWAMESIKFGQLDIGMPTIRAYMQKFGDVNEETAAGVAKLLDMAKASNPISTNAVSDALNVAEGRLTL